MKLINREHLHKLEKNINWVYLTHSKFIPVPHSIFRNITLNKSLTKRQKDTLWLVIRLSVGCQKLYAKLSRRDMRVLNIYYTDATRILRSLHEMELIKWDKEKNVIYLTSKLIHNIDEKSRKRMKQILSENVVSNRRSKQFALQND